MASHTRVRSLPQPAIDLFGLGVARGLRQFEVALQERGRALNDQELTTIFGVLARFMPPAITAELFTVMERQRALHEDEGRA